MSTKLASFPNSRIKPRPATRERFTDDFAVTVASQELLPINVNRTTVTIYNDGPNEAFYKYGDGLNITTEGFKIPVGSSQSDIDTTQSIWVGGGNTTFYVDRGEG